MAASWRGGEGERGRGELSGTASDSMQSAGALCVLGAAGAAAFLWYAATADGWMGDARRRALTAVRLRQQAGVIDGKAIAAEVRGEVAARILALNENYPKKQFQPGLAVVIVGDRKDSQTYVRMKRRACEEVAVNLGVAALRDLEPEDLAALTMEASAMAGVPLAGTGHTVGVEDYHHF